MGFPRRQLGRDEYVVEHTRTHAKVLIGRALLLIVLGGLAGAGVAAMPSSTRPWGPLAVVLAGAVAVVYGVLRPYLRWWTTTYTLTNRRLVVRYGVLARNGDDIGLDQVVDVSYQRSLADRMFGCGTLEVRTASEFGEATWADVPEVQQLHRSITELAFAGGNPVTLAR